MRAPPLGILSQGNCGAAAVSLFRSRGHPARAPSGDTTVPPVVCSAGAIARIVTKAGRGSARWTMQQDIGMTRGWTRDGILALLVLLAGGGAAYALLVGKPGPAPTAARRR